MSVVSKIKLPSNTTVDIHDARISEPTSSDNNKVLSVINTSGTLGWVTPATEIYWCTYGTTAQSDIATAIAAGKLPACKYGDNIYVYAGESSAGYSQFTSVLYNTASRIYVKNSAWGNASFTVADSSAVHSIPSGGTTGQVLSKVDGTDYNTQWTTPQGGGGISTLNISIIPDLGEYSLGTKAQAATVLGITEAELDALMAGNYDRLVFENAIYADRTEAVDTYQSNVSVNYSYTGGNPLRFVFSTDGVEYFSFAERIVPELSTSISSDGNSAAKAATPKAVKDYVDDLPIPRVIFLGTFTPTESSSYISLGNASAAAASLNIEEEELYNLYEGVYNRLLMYDIATGKVRIAHDALRIDEGGGATYEILAPDGTPYVLDFLYESSAYKYRYYQLQGGGSSDAVLYTAQTLTTSQQTQARTNIAAVGYNVTSTGTPVVLGLEQTTNKVTSLSSSSTDTQYPSAKCVYDYIDDTVGDIATLLAAI